MDHLLKEVFIKYCMKYIYNLPIETPHSVDDIDTWKVANVNGKASASIKIHDTGEL